MGLLDVVPTVFLDPPPPRPPRPGARSRGLKRARANGKILGRPKIAASTERSIRKALAKGDKGILKVAAEFGVGSGTVQRIKAEMAAEAD